MNHSHSRLLIFPTLQYAATLASALMVLALSRAQEATPAKADPAAVKFFETKIRPLLNDQCMKCHGEKKQKGGLRLDSFQAASQGGDSGVAVTPGDVSHSLLYKAVTYVDQDMQMPPDNKLEANQIADLKKWIELGAPWPDDVKQANAHKPGEFTAEDRAWWAFQPVKKVSPPEIASDNGRVQNPIDQFVLDKLKREGLPQAPEADRSELIRRVSFDLNGLPPTAVELEKMAADKNPKFYETLVDTLLDNPRYGERWAQHWLDLVRYAESDGFRQDAFRPDAWRYRDYVVRSFNEDKPYDQFVREQLAGDEIAPEDPDALVATGFFRQTVYEYNQRDADGQRTGILNDITDVAGELFMGLSFGCARCHDHKFDPILQKDYYRLQAFFAPIGWRDDMTLATPEQRKAHEEKMTGWNAATAGIRARMDAALKPKIAAAKRNQAKKFPDDVQEMYYKPEEQKTAYEKQMSYFVQRQSEEEAESIRSGKAKGSPAKAFLAELKRFDNIKPADLPRAFAATDVGLQAPPVKFSSRRSGEVEVQPGFLTILDPNEATITPLPNLSSTGRRSALAAWLTKPDNMLASRVIVNRVWQYHFGRGLVSTSSDFGRLGDKPSHPELLDWLTTEFVKNGWSLKWLHRVILNSATYKQTTRVKPSEIALKKDPDNRWLWRMTPRRLDASQARDALLVMSGELQPTNAGPSVEPVIPVRTLFTRKIRNRQDDFLRNFDAPAGFQSVSLRDETTTALQSLLMVNGDWPLRRAQGMAATLLKNNTNQTETAVLDAYESAFGRVPKPTEVKDALMFINEQRLLIEGESARTLEAAPPVVDAATSFGDSPLLASRTVPVVAQDGGIPRAVPIPQAIVFKPGTINEKLRVITNEDREGDEFTVEAVVNLDSIYDDVGVRTIAARWNNDKAAKGWAMGITGKATRYESNNLIMQLVGDDFQRSVMHEVVVSGIKIPVGVPCYVAAVVSNHPANDQMTGGTVTFYAKNLADPNAQLEVVVVPHQLVGGYVDHDRALFVGGVDGDARGLWDGAMARVLLCTSALTPPQLLVSGSNEAPKCLFDLQGSTLGSTSEPLFSWEKNSSGKSHVKNVQMEAFADFCHALINSNEFLYLH